MSALLLQFQPTTIVNLALGGFALGGVTGMLIGCIAWVASERGTRGLAAMAVGAIIGLIAGFFFVGTDLLQMFSNLEALLENANQTSANTFNSIVQLAMFAMGGATIGGAVSSLRRTLTGIGVGLLAGTLAGVMLILINNQTGFNITGAAATIIVGALTLVLVVIMSVGQTD